MFIYLQINRNQVSSIIPAIEKARLHRRKGGEIMRAAVSRFIECISFSQLPLPEKKKTTLAAQICKKKKSTGKLFTYRQILYI